MVDFIRKSKDFIRNSIDFIRNSIDFKRKPIDFMRKSIDFNGKSIGFIRKSIDSIRKSIDFNRRSIDFNRRSIDFLHEFNKKSILFQSRPLLAARSRMPRHSKPLIFLLILIRNQYFFSPGRSWPLAPGRPGTRNR